MVFGIIGLIISIWMAAWLYQVVNKNDGQLPWLWAAGAFMFWPLVSTIAGYKYEETAIMVVGMTGLILFVMGIVAVAMLLPILL